MILRVLAQARSEGSVLSLFRSALSSVFQSAESSQKGRNNSATTDCARRSVNSETVSYEQLVDDNGHQTATTFCLEKESSWPIEKTATKRSQWVQWLFKSQASPPKRSVAVLVAVDF
jgi:hypothetical protein